MENEKEINNTEKCLAEGYKNIHDVDTSSDGNHVNVEVTPEYKNSRRNNIKNHIEELKKDEIFERFRNKYRMINWNVDFGYYLFIELSENYGINVFDEELEIYKSLADNHNDDVVYYHSILSRIYKFSRIVQNVCDAEYYRTFSDYNIPNLLDTNGLMFRMIDSLNTLLIHDEEFRGEFKRKYENR